MITYEVHVCIGEDNPEKRVAVKCHDTGVNLMVYLEVCHPGRWRDFTEPYRIPAGSTAVIKIAKPDKTYCVCEGELVNGGVFFKLPPQSFTAAGVARAEVSLFGQDSRRLTSATFYIHVPEECICDSEGEFESYVDVMAEQIKVAVDAAETATEQAQKVEEAVVRSPIISDAGTWLVWDFAKGEYVDTGVPASGGGGGSEDAVLYTKQELADEQQAQARANIDAISSADIPKKISNPYPLEITYANPAGSNYPGTITYDGSSLEKIDIRSNFTEWRSDMGGYIKNNPFAGSGKTYQPTGANWTNEFSQSSILNFEIDGTQYYNVEGVQGSPMYMLEFTCGDYTISLNCMNTTFSISPVLSDNKWFLIKIGTLPQVNMEADPELDMQIATKKYVDNHTAASGKDGITPHIGDNGNWYLGDTDTGKPSKGADGAGMDVTGATVGQIAKITAVDTNGKPTQWEAVDMPSGLPKVTETNNGQFLRVVNGEWAADTIPSAGGVSF